jgi:hypothetical protein
MRKTSGRYRIAAEPAVIRLTLAAPGSQRASISTNLMITSL